jgi:AcrR family transcriptional regulator
MPPTHDHAPARSPRRGLSEKREAIMRGALTVFARDGYTRAGIDAIAKEAGVSTRTIYNHFADKRELFTTVIQESATQVADAHVAEVERHLGEVTDLEADLIALGVAMADPVERFVAHFTLVGHIHAEIAHLPAEAVEGWRTAGPLRTQRALTDRVGALVERGLLSAEGEDVSTVARHFMLLATGEVTSRTFRGVVEVPREEIVEAVTAGVRAFLRAYGTRGPLR